MKLNCGCHAEYHSRPWMRCPDCQTFLEFGGYAMEWHECPLHAAARDLLAALKAVMPYATMMEVSMTAEAMSGEGGEPADNYLSAISDARDVIARAEGER